ncbi:MAG TPA: VOC family protein [Intrasporangium sp.]|nr:VOC family protein [Intrasporangium sp.]
MTSYISHTTVDCRNAYELSEWWKQVLGYTDIPDDPNAPEHDECMIQKPGGGHLLLFIEVPDDDPTEVGPWPAKRNRIHFDLRPSDRSQADEVERVLALGATQRADLREQWGPLTGWVVLADPEGNEFCILRSQAEVDERERLQAE